MLSSLIPGSATPHIRGTPAKQILCEARDTPSLMSAFPDTFNGIDGLDSSSYSPSYSQKMDNLRIKSDFEQDGSEMVLAAGHQSDLVSVNQRNSRLFLQKAYGEPSQGSKRKAPTSTFSSDSSINPDQSSGDISIVSSCLSAPPVRFVPANTSVQVHRSIPIKSEKPTSGYSPTSSLSSLSESDEASEESNSERPARNRNGKPHSPSTWSVTYEHKTTSVLSAHETRKQSRYTSVVADTADRQSRRRSTRFGSTHKALSYAESDDDDPETMRNKAKSGRERKHRRISVIP